MNRPIRRVAAAIVVLVLALVVQLTYLQVVDAKHLENDPRNVRTAVRDYNRPRGDILSADAQVVAHSVPSKGEFAYQRQYPLGPLFSQISGYQSFIFGNTGVEKTYNNALVGRDFKLTDLGDVLIGKKKTGTLVLTVDSRVQAKARDELGSQHGSIVAIDPRDGSIKALYSNPTYDPSPLAGHDAKAVQATFTQLTNDPAKPNLARTYREIFPPGSTFKTVTTTVGLDTGVTDLNKQYPTLMQLPLPQSTKPISNFGGESCGGSLEESFIQSCNTTFAQIGLDLAERFPPGIAKFGIGSAPPLDVDPGAVRSTGPVAGTFSNNKPSFAQAGIGQGPDAVTPLQMALVASAIADKGVIMTPHVGGEIRDQDGKTVRTIAAKPWTAATTPATAATLTTFMEQVVASGTGTSAQINGVTVAGKTGTAQVQGQTAPDAWFIAFAPAEAPRIAVAVLVEGKGSEDAERTGGAVAGPIAAAMIQTLLGIG